MEVRSHHCCILLIRSKKQVLPTLKGRGMHGSVSEVEITGGHLQILCTTLSTLRNLWKTAHLYHSSRHHPVVSLPARSNIRRPPPSTHITHSWDHILGLAITHNWTIFHAPLDLGTPFSSIRFHFSSNIFTDDFYAHPTTVQDLYVKCFYTKIVNPVNISLIIGENLIYLSFLKTYFLYLRIQFPLWSCFPHY